MVTLAPTLSVMESVFLIFTSSLAKVFNVAVIATESVSVIFKSWSSVSEIMRLSTASEAANLVI